MNPSYIDLSPSKPPVYIIPWKSLKLFLNLWLCINICVLLPTSNIKKFSTPNQIPRKRLDWFSWNFVWVLGRSENRPTYIFIHLNDKGDQFLNIFFVFFFIYGKITLSWSTCQINTQKIVIIIYYMGINAITF